MNSEGRLFELVAPDEWPGHDWEQHRDIQQALEYLKRNPDAAVKIRVEPHTAKRKRHAVTVYGERSGMRLQTRLRNNWLLFRLRREAKRQPGSVKRSA